MPKGRQHELIRDACLTVGHVVQSYVPRYVDDVKIEVVYDPPSEDAVQKLKDKVLVTVLWIDTKRSTMIQTTKTPLVHDEDEEGNIVEYRLGPPTYLTMRFLITAWSSSNLVAQTVTGAIMQHVNSYPELSDEDVQGESIYVEDKPFIAESDLGLQDQMRFWDGLQRPFRPSLAVKMDLRMDSVHRVAVRRVREKINLYRKVEG